MDDPAATQSDMDTVLQLLVQLTETTTALTMLVGRLIQLQLRGIDWAERGQPAPAKPPVKFTEHGEDAMVEQALQAAAEAQAMLDALRRRR